MKTDEEWMYDAWLLAQKAAEIDEVPVGALLVYDNKLIASGYNASITKNDPTAHAEMIALRLAAKKIQNYRLIGMRLYTTLEPCCMCAGAIIHARVNEVIIGTTDPKAGCVGSVLDILHQAEFNHQVTTKVGVLAEPCANILRSFFKQKRQKK